LEIWKDIGKRGGSGVDAGSYKEMGLELAEIKGEGSGVGA